MRVVQQWWTVLIGMTLAGALHARPLALEDVPAPLQPWIDWVLLGHDTARCPHAHDNHGIRTCAWPGALNLDLEPSGGRFELRAQVYAQAWLVLPGDTKRWPQEVTVDDAPATVLARDGRPAIQLNPGEHRVSGRFFWDELPETLTTPADVGLVRLTVSGRRVEFPDVNAGGELWLKQQDGRAGHGEADAVTLRVYRQVVDDLPMQVTTHLDLQVSGRSRELVLAPALPAGFEPVALDTPLPAEVRNDGTLRLQIRPGHWQVRVHARALADQTRLVSPPRSAPWPMEEIWVFEARNALRLVEIEGAPAVDPRQTGLPGEWQHLPAYLLAPGAALTLKVIRRGDPEPAPDQLQLERELRLDFDGGGYTIADRMSGTLSRTWRLQALPELMLGRVSLDGEPQLVTTRPGSDARGVEARRGALALDADSRHERGRTRLPAVGWDHDVQQLGATLHLPPGWRLFGTTGVDHADNTWLARWTLLDLFLVLIIMLATARLWTWRQGVLALATLVLIWHEPGAPRQVWLHLLAAIALTRLLPVGRLQRLASWYRNGALLVLIVIAIPFSVTVLRTALYPQLGDAGLTPLSVGMSADAWQAGGVAQAPAELQEFEDRARSVPEVAGAPMLADQLAPAAPPPQVQSTMVEEIKVAALKRAGLDETYNAQTQRLIDPSANVQTGPGVPTWQWTRVRLQWNGPVTRDQSIRLWLMSPGLMRVIGFLAVGLSFALVGVLLRTVWRERASGRVSAVTLLALLSVPLLLAAPDAARADYPGPELLNDLRARLLAAPECLPACAAIPRARLELVDDVLSLRLDVVAAESVAIPLPSDVAQWLPGDVSIDGDLANDRLQRRGAQLWLALPKGAHQVLLLGPVPGRASFDLPLPLTPHHLEVEVQGWTVDGILEDRRPAGQLRLSRLAPAPRATAESVLEETAGTTQPLTPFVRLERTLELGLEWRVHSRIVRLSPPGVAVVLEVPVLAGESVTTPEVTVKDGKVQVNMAPGVSAMSWSSTLERADTVTLTAPQTTAWTEIWRADVAPIWRVETRGLAVVQHQDPSGQWLPQWHPWPGESVTLAVTRPEGVGEATLTVDAVSLATTPGKRATDAQLHLNLRSSQGGQHTLTVPPEAVLQSVLIDGALQPIRQEGQAVTLPIRPGPQQVVLSWRTASGIGTWLRTPALDLGSASVNIDLHVNLAPDRWVLLTGGPLLGPAVLFWSLLIVVALLALALSRIPGVPLTATAWFLLGVGLTQVDVWAGLLVVGWLLALAGRARLNAALPSWLFNLVQLGLLVLTLIAFAALFEAIRVGLLGNPDMQLGGHGSTPQALHWYQDRAGGVLPRAYVVSVPLLVYRGLMLGWALWLAFALLGWLRWAWQCYGVLGLWRPWRAPPQSAPAG